MTSVGSTDESDLEVIGKSWIDEEISTPKRPIEESWIDEEPIGEELGTEEYHAQNLSTPLKPTINNELGVGKIFKSIDEAKICYNEYSGNNGFSIHTRTTYKSKSGEPNGVMFSCICEGTYKPKMPRDEDGKTKRMGSTTRTGCKANMRIKLIPTSGLWEVSIFNDNHNHLLATPSKRVHLKSNKNVFKEAKLLAEHFHEVNIPISRVVPLLGDRDNVPIDSRDLYNHMAKLRKINYGKGDAEGVKRYFQMVAADNPQYYYAIQCDEWGRAQNFFWIDAKSRIAYGQFGEAVTFDTTYNTNKYKMPFAPFTGVNHHRQSVLFGCALLENETEETFTWLFQTWLHAMGGKAPSAIITDQDPAMAKAIATVFPNARHRFCLWHIKKKFIEKLGNIYSKRSKFKRDVKQCTRLCHSIEEFEEQWADLLVTYELQENNWMKHLYTIRAQWIPVYCQNTFYAGMNTTQRSESINAFFGDFVTRKTDLRQFVRKYDQAMLQIYVRERKEDFHSIYKKRSLMFKVYILEHVAGIYTRNMFLKFSKEWEKTFLLNIEEREIVEGVRTYMVQYRFEDTYESVVRFSSFTMEGSCGCKLFEFTGIPCMHLLKVFDRLCLNEIPPYFIMKRWTKDANRVQVTAPDGIVFRNKNIGTEAARVSDICKRATQLAYIMCRSEKGYEKLCDLLAQGFEVAQEIDEELLKQENDLPNKADGSTFLGHGDTGMLLLDPHVSQTKGRKRAVKEGNELPLSHKRSMVLESGNARWRSGLEKSCPPPKARCQYCFGEYPKKHDSRNCPKKKEMELQAALSKKKELQAAVSRP